MTYTNDSPEASLPRFSKGLQRQPEDFQRLTYEEESWRFDIGLEAFLYGQKARWDIVGEGGKTIPHSEWKESIVFILPKGTRVAEYNVPAARNSYNWIASDCVICLPSGKIIVLEQNGSSDSIWVASGPMLEEIKQAMEEHPDA